MRQSRTLHRGTFDALCPNDHDFELMGALPATHGLFDRLSFAACYNFSQRDMAAAFAAASLGLNAPDPFKAMCHETSHLYQALTPYGLYYHLLREFQLLRVFRLIRFMTENYGLRIKYPLLRYCTSKANGLRRTDSMRTRCFGADLGVARYRQSCTSVR